MASAYAPNHCLPRTTHLCRWVTHTSAPAGRLILVTPVALRVAMAVLGGDYPTPLSLSGFVSATGLRERVQIRQ